MRCLPLDEFNIVGISKGLEIALKLDYLPKYQPEWLELSIMSHQILNYLRK